MSPVSRKRKAVKKKKKPQSGLRSKETIKYICLQCSSEEEIPLQVVRNFDVMDDGDPTVPPQFRCEECGGAMYPEYYKGVHGYEYRIIDVKK
jgi:uncharacterized Zn finger protein